MRGLRTWIYTQPERGGPRWERLFAVDMTVHLHLRLHGPRHILLLPLVCPFQLAIRWRQDRATQLLLGDTRVDSSAGADTGSGGGDSGHRLRGLRRRRRRGARPLKRFERCPPCAYARRHVLCGAELATARLYRAAGRAVDGLRGRGRAASAASGEHRRVALVRVLL